MEEGAGHGVGWGRGSNHRVISRATKRCEGEFPRDAGRRGHTYLEDGVHDAAEGSVVGELCYSEDVETPLVQILQLLVAGDGSR